MLVVNQGEPVAGMTSTCIAMPERSGMSEPAKIGECIHSSRWMRWPGLSGDAEERIADPIMHCAPQRAAGDADADSLVPVDDRREIRRDQPLDIVAYAGRQLAALSARKPARQFSAPWTP